MITRTQALKFIEENYGRFISIEFFKRGTGELRRMTFRQGVVKHLKGGQPSYDFTQQGILPVFDVVKNAYRAIPKEGITRIKINGVWQNVYQSKNQQA